MGNFERNTSAFACVPASFINQSGKKYLRLKSEYLTTTLSRSHLFSISTESVNANELLHLEHLHCPKGNISGGSINEMLGLVNLPSESVDFYAQPKNSHSSLTFPGRCKNKPTVLYTDDGRRIIDGKVMGEKEPQEMWNNLLINLFIKSIARRPDGSSGNSSEAQSTRNGVIKSTVSEDMLDLKPTALTATSNLNSENTVLVSQTVQSSCWLSSSQLHGSQRMLLANNTLLFVAILGENSNPNGLDQRIGSKTLLHLW
uniref:Thioredoxin_14 domain-containing protein n=1 Tax=Elaeophora elaphi TaxID=1147741 RepID=A0A158Q7R5_9BILA